MTNIVTTAEPELFSDAQAKSRTARRSSAPNDGMSLENAIATKGKWLREAVNGMAVAFDGTELTASFAATFAPRFCGSRVPELSSSRRAQRVAWNLACVWLLYRHARGEKCGLAEAEDWFRGAAVVPVPRFADAFSSDARWRAEQQLGALTLDAEFWDLLPYLLEEHGTGSRASVMRDPGTKQARDAKRKDGVFYTPSDVADYMVRHCLQGTGGSNGRSCLDPASGTGVFQLALLCAAEAEQGNGFDRFDYAIRHLHGLDVSGHALDACAFVLLQACWRDVERRGLSPWAAWHRLRMNLVQVDALTVQPWRADGAAAKTRESFSDIADRLSATPSGFVEAATAPMTQSSDDAGLFGNGGVSLSELFPAVDGGFHVLAGNPPYAAIGERTDFANLAGTFRALPDSAASARTNLFPLFIEMMWRLTTPGRAAAALVTPLSIAYHGGSQYENCRRAMSAAGGRWQFAFFDREPHALFGEEVKTRNAILFRFEDRTTPLRGQLAEIETGPLRKWTSRTRNALFESIGFTALGPAIISHGIPKLGGGIQASAFCALRRVTGRLPSWCVRVGTCQPEEAIGEQSTHRVFVGGTAYNFLNVYRCAELADDERTFPMSESAVQCLEFRSQQDAEAVFAILSSRVVFWLWHVLGDGFHVPGWLWDEVPISRGMFDAPSLAALATHGRELWQRLREHRFTSLNGGKLTIGYRPLRCHEERDAIDALLIKSAGLPVEFLDELRSFVHGNAVVDASDERRQHLHQVFSTPSPT